MKKHVTQRIVLFYMRKILAIVIILTSINSFAQISEMKGNGIISVDIQDLPQLEFYSSVNSDTPIKTVKVFMDESINSFNLENYEQLKDSWFKPIHFNLDYFMFDMQCTEIANNWFQIIVNEETNLKYWIRKSPILKYETWGNFISQVVGVVPINPEENPILKSPQIDSEKTEKQPIDCLTPVTVTNDWLKVRVEPAICDMTHQMDEDEIFDGFIRWRKGNKLLIKYYLLL